MTKHIDHTCDVLIVGAGVSGLFAASRLLEHDPNQTILIVDKLNRTGGRLQTTTVAVCGTDGAYYDVRNEEGGMRFCPEGTGMPNLWKLINTLDLMPVPFPMGGPENRYFFRGQSFIRAQTPAIWAKIFSLAPSEQGKDPGTIFGKVMTDILTLDENKDRALAKKDVLSPSTPDEWIQFRNTFTYQGTVINHWGLWALLREYGLTQECISWLDRAIGFMGPIDAFINAGEGMQIILDFPNAPSFCALPEGYQSLTDHLASRVRDFGGQLILGETIQSIKDDGPHKLVTGTQFTYRAKQVILAVPRSAIEQLAGASPILAQNKPFMEAAGSVHNMELSKIGLYFDRRWWLDPTYNVNISSGPSFSDLAAGSVYAFARYPENPKADAAYTGPSALTIYTDFIRGNFWKELHNIGDPYTTDAFPKNPDNTTAASESLVAEAMRQIKMIFGLDPSTDVPAPVLSTYRVWGQDGFSAGYHQYKLNVDDRQVYDAIWNPAPGVYVCNEAWSPEQGWVEGSLMATDHVMQTGFSLPPYTVPDAPAPPTPARKSHLFNQY